MPEPAERGYRIAIQRVSRVAPRPWLVATIGAELVIIAALFIIPWGTIFAVPAAPVPVAHVAPAAPAPTPTPPQVIQVNGEHGAVCITPLSKVRHPALTVKVP